mmetsp:Transcript_17284/g.23764  ORF Transcript_17284/g.23764 Transcript_17284/m.23764 type:complete len:99 (+) Transcript_17284:197-493(+)|eukprot:CAMPEP_0170115496 /NCGR_PEP_ID=MMETSP0020_2-20130122/11537_1 /TAXON_ID=98059 /ORGANISM="Dinobryon sp., Strain UTEXLB2267" /LENGTH=98 /DNA_ID=CAMNT_0010343091 /DNA_START=148 /DNA_END=444 /DNA_ORIENTATION=+
MTDLLIKAQNNKKQIKICHDFMIVKSSQEQSRLDASQAFYHSMSNLEKLFRRIGKSHRVGFHTGVVNGVPYNDIYMMPIGCILRESATTTLTSAGLTW